MSCVPCTTSKKRDLHLDLLNLKHAGQLLQDLNYHSVLRAAQKNKLYNFS